MKNEFEEVYDKFTTQKHKIPADMAFKLQFMHDYIGNKGIVSSLTEEQQDTIKDILDLEDKAIVLLFVSIVKSILSPNMYCSFEKNCKIKVEGYLARWTNAYITFEDQESITFNTFKKKLRFVLKNLELKYSSAPTNDPTGLNGTVNLDSSEVNSEVFNSTVMTKSTILAKSQRKSEKKFKVQFVYKGFRKLQVKFDHKKAADSIIANITQMQAHLEQYEQKSMDGIKQNQIFSQSLLKDYSTQYESKEFTFKVHRKEPKVFSEVFMQGHFWDLGQIVEFFVVHKNWNSKIKEQKIRKEGDRAYIFQRKFKSNAILANQRRIVTRLQLFKTGENTFLAQEQAALECSTFKANKSLSEIYIYYSFEVLAPKIMKVNIQTYFNGRGLFKQSDSRSLIVQYFSDMVFINARFTKLKSKGKLIFELDLQKIIQPMPKHVKSSLPSHSDRIKSEEQKSSQHSSNHKAENDQQTYYSVQKNKRNSGFNMKAIQDNETNLEELKEEDNEDEFYDIPQGEWYEDEEDEEEVNSKIQERVSGFEQKQLNVGEENGEIQEQEKFATIQKEQKVQLQEGAKGKKQKGDKSIKKCSVKENYQMLCGVMPKDYQSQIKVQYLKALRNKSFQNYYLNSYFNESIREKFKEKVPWYDPRILMKSGKEYRPNEQKQLIFINQDLIESQKDSLKWVIKQIGANLISGKSVLNVSLPVDIFEPRSFLERSAASFGCAPKYLRPVAEADTMTQMKAVTSFLFSVVPLDVVMQKPFNPILGQTFQGYLGGIPIFYEQISHHPPVSAYYMKCEEFTMQGTLGAVANVSLNSANGGNSGKMFITMKNGNQFEVSFFPAQIGGLIFGQRKFSITNKAFVLNKTERLVTELSAVKQSKCLYERRKDQKQTKGDILGGIFRVSQKCIQTLSSQKTLLYNPGLKKADVEEKLSEIHGIWFEDIYIDNELTNKDITAYPLQYPDQKLPSDCNFRLDVMMHRMGDLARSQTEKQVLETLQRADRKLRDKHGPKK